MSRLRPARLESESDSGRTRVTHEGTTARGRSHQHNGDVYNLILGYSNPGATHDSLNPLRDNPCQVFPGTFHLKEVCLREQQEMGIEPLPLPSLPQQRQSPPRPMPALPLKRQVIPHNKTLLPIVSSLTNLKLSLSATSSPSTVASIAPTITSTSTENGRRGYTFEEVKLAIKEETLRDEVDTLREVAS